MLSDSDYFNVDPDTGIAYLKSLGYTSSCLARAIALLVKGQGVYDRSTADGAWLYAAFSRNPPSECLPGSYATTGGSGRSEAGGLTFWMIGLAIAGGYIVARLTR